MPEAKWTYLIKIPTSFIVFKQSHLILERKYKVVQSQIIISRIFSLQYNLFIPYTRKYMRYVDFAS